MKVEYWKDRGIIRVGQALFSDECLASIARTPGVYVHAGPIALKGTGYETIEFERVDELVNRAADVLETALSARSPADKDECIRAARAGLAKIADKMLVADAIAPLEV